MLLRGIQGETAKCHETCIPGDQVNTWDRNKIISLYSVSETTNVCSFEKNAAEAGDTTQLWGSICVCPLG